MSTNFYIKKKIYPDCEHCGRGEEFEEIHIGKRGGGYAFTHSPEFTNFKLWEKYLNENKDNIYNEYDENIDIAEMLSIMKDKGVNEVKDTLQFKWKDYMYLDAEGYLFMKEKGFS